MSFNRRWTRIDADPRRLGKSSRFCRRRQVSFEDAKLFRPRCRSGVQQEIAETAEFAQSTASALSATSCSICFFALDRRREGLCTHVYIPPTIKSSGRIGHHRGDLRETNGDGNLGRSLRNQSRFPSSSARKLGVLWLLPGCKVCPNNFPVGHRRRGSLLLPRLDLEVCDRCFRRRRILIERLIRPAKPSWRYFDRQIVSRDF